MAASVVVATSAWGAAGPELITVTSSEAEPSAEIYDGVVDGIADRVVFVDGLDAEDDGSDVYVRDRSAGTTTKVYTSADGYSADADISGSGKYVVISIGNAAGNDSLRVRSIATGSTRWLHGYERIRDESISANGR